MAAALIRWLDEQLAVAGLARTGPVSERVRPWSTVLGARTTGGPVWLKVPGAGAHFEVALYDVLVRRAPEHVLHPLASDISRGLLLLPDGGAALDAGADLRPALRAYAGLQRDLADQVEELLAAGVPDMRPAVLPERFDEAVSFAGDDLDPRIARLRPQFLDWCAALGATPGGASLDHNDLHAHNILAGPVFYDWGDACVAHPLTSLLVPLQVAAPEDRDGLRDAFLDAAGLTAHAAMVPIARKVALVARALTWKRALLTAGAADRERYGNPVAAHLALLAD